MLCFHVALLCANKGLKNTFFNVANHHDLYTIFSNIYIYKKRQKQENIVHDAGHYM